MPNSPVDPSSLEGDALKRWYQRSPADIEQERQAARLQNYNNFFGGLRNSPSAPDGSGLPNDTWSSTGSAAAPTPLRMDAVSDGYLPGLLGNMRSLASPTNGPSASEGSADQTPNPYGQTNASVGSIPNNLYDEGLAGPDDGGTFSLVGNSANPRLRREWSQKWGLPWPKDPITGQNDDVAHIIARGDGGKDHVDNIRPMPRADHLAEHMANGDLRRWALRPGIARAFGGTVARSLGPLSIFSDILGMISGRIRHDNFDNFSSDMMGIPSQEDRQKALEDQQRSINPNWKRGDPIVFQL